MLLVLNPLQVQQIKVKTSFRKIRLTQTVNGSPYDERVVGSFCMKLNDK